MKNITNKIPVKGSTLPSLRHKGAALLMTIAVLVILTTVVYSLVSRLSIYKRRQHYMISYQAARYACDSAMKYALIKSEDIKPKLETREDSPDFSDLFHMSYEKEQEMLEEWAEIKTLERMEELENKGQNGNQDPIDSSMDFSGDTNDPNNLNNLNLPGDPNEGGFFNLSGISKLRDDGSVDPNSLTIPGPYGVEWPYIAKPLEFKIGDAKVTIKIRDENAKMPLTWSITKDAKDTRAADLALLTFCQWMQMDDEHIENLMIQLDEVKEKKPYSKNLKPIDITKKVIPPKRAKNSKSKYRRPKSKPRTETKKKTRPAAGHISDFARLLHSSLIDTDALAMPLPDTGERYESALKYLALWGSQKVNINTAPRHVLEAVFTFGGDQEEIANEIIEQRQIKPFKDIAEFKQKNYKYSDSIRKVEPYILTQSIFFAIEVTATCGTATVSSIAAVRIEKGKLERIAIMSN